ncbi:hypothetical protein [Holdemania sp. 1001095H_141210_F2]|uniref:hypothetical protein n=2 Tax=unclassified Holdemania TaxID=2637685 RepID=UPI0009325F46|nr:hypothetical protein [Holdemania sp. 1001095H_141210_F2]
MKKCLLIIVCSIISLLFFNVLTLFVYCTQSEFLGVKFLRTASINNVNSQITYMSDMELNSVTAYIQLNFEGRSCKINKPEGLIGGYYKGPYYCDNDVPWIIYFGKKYNTIIIEDVYDMKKENNGGVSYKHSGIFYVGINVDEYKMLRMTRHDYIKKITALIKEWSPEFD